ncbi:MULTISPECIES: Crp/Fnr family transcriptional regulator [unclassified Polaribacter]|jgi:CRP/FNR family transcriptional regulator|uniref:Crp/Fnr family transcriptional regulator n=1 Tax=unclassified Polaribacter TaxID=196858 RepID=UPI00052E0E3F|nr:MULTISPECIES: Crp/Fnr family transcriptional regulator [unclassified Polaribacter]KGL59333.1 transcriptional regulator, Crp/Fnr family [Polaribacter sp. Hel1_33_49]PKV63813.1 CRP/FNR family transcriptional regulator [Polaribacter sp. Hel1_33_96]
MLEAINKLTTNFGYLFEEDLISEISELGISKAFIEDSKIIEVGDYIRSMPLLISGAIKILREDEHGEELVLYYLEKGDTCAMTLSCCMGQTKSKIRAVAETNVELIMLPKEKMLEWLGKYKTWQTYILQSYHSRMDELLEAVDTIAFLKMDERLFKYLKDKAMVVHNDVLHVTHKEIAEDLHTSRVVISRLLKKLENEGKIKLFRNSIKVLEL